MNAKKTTTKTASKKVAPTKAKKASKPAAAKALAPAKPSPAKKLSQIDAAAQVLTKSGESMNTLAMVEAMTKAGLWSSPNGKTPEATLYAAILREITTKGRDARFKKVDRGQFALAGK
jgi:vancomycin resistance protein YoaR